MFFCSPSTCSPFGDMPAWVRVDLALKDGGLYGSPPSVQKLLHICVRCKHEDQPSCMLTNSLFARKTLLRRAPGCSPDPEGSRQLSSSLRPLHPALPTPTGVFLLLFLFNQPEKGSRKKHPHIQCPSVPSPPPQPAPAPATRSLRAAAPACRPPGQKPQRQGSACS